MDAGKLFSELVNRQPDQSGGILTGTAVSDSVDGTVMVQMDGSVVAQPGEDEVTLTVSADDFVDGSYVLPSVPYAGSLTITDSGGNELEEQDYELDGARLTIFALSSSPIDIAYQTQVQQQVTNEDFDGDRYSLASTTNLTVEEMDSEGAWNPATYTLDGNIMTIAGIGHQAGIVEFSYIYDVSVVCEPGENVLPDSPDEVSVLGRNSSGVDVVVTDYSLDGNVITLPTTYDAYTVDYPVTTTETWNVSDQYQDEPLEDSDDAADPATVTIGHDLQWPPSSVVSCTIDGVAATYALDDVNVVVDAPAVAERWFRLTYDAPVSLQVPASVFASGAFTLPSIPLGSVSTVRAGVVLANTVDDDQLSIASLVVDSPTYSIAYTEQVEQDVVELPCTPYVAEGQFVEIAVVNGMPTVIGASGSGDVTMTLAGDAADAAAAAEEAAAAAQEIAEATGQHVWGDANGEHVTEATMDEFLQTPTGRNILMNAAGILLRDALVNLLQLSRSGMAIYDGQGNDATNVVAQFTQNLISLSPQPESGESTASIELFDGQGLIECLFGQTRSRLNLSAGSVWVQGYDSANLTANMGAEDPARLWLTPTGLGLDLQNLYGVINSWGINGETNIISGPGSALDTDRIIDLHVDPTNGADYDVRLVAASDGTNFSVFVRDPTSTNDITQFYLFGGGAGAKGRIMQRTSTDGGSTWRAQHGVRSPWTSLGSFTGTGNLSYSLTEYEEVMYSAKANGKLVTATVAKQLLTSSAQELWLGGGKSATNVANGGNLRAVINVSLTGCHGINFSEGSSDRTSSTTWNVYAR